MKFIFLAVAIGLSLAAMPLTAQDQRPGILNQPAPTWGVTQWLNLPKDKPLLDITDYKGKVIYLYGFQSWCPGCHQHGFPTLKEITSRYASDTNVAIVAVQTTFEGFQANGFEQAKQIAKRYNLNIPIGQSGTAQEPSPLMRRYRTGGTPWVVIIDRQGVVRFNDFHIEAEAAARLIDRLKQTPDKPATQTNRE